MEKEQIFTEVRTPLGVVCKAVHSQRPQAHSTEAPGSRQPESSLLPEGLWPLLV